MAQFYRVGTDVLNDRIHWDARSFKIFHQNNRFVTTEKTLRLTFLWLRSTLLKGMVLS